MLFVCLPEGNDQWKKKRMVSGSYILGNHQLGDAIFQGNRWIMFGDSTESFFQLGFSEGIRN